LSFFVVPCQDTGSTAFGVRSTVVDPGVRRDDEKYFPIQTHYFGHYL